MDGFDLSNLTRYAPPGAQFRIEFHKHDYAAGSTGNVHNHNHLPGNGGTALSDEQFAALNKRLDALDQTVKEGFNSQGKKLNEILAQKGETAPQKPSAAETEAAASRSQAKSTQCQGICVTKPGQPRCQRVPAEGKLFCFQHK